MKKIKSIIALIICIISVAGCAPKTEPDGYETMLMTEIPTETTVPALPPFSEETTVAPEEPVSSETTSATTPTGTAPAETTYISGSQPMQRADIGFSNSVNTLGVSLYDEIKGEGNVFYSPYSIDIALSMLVNGADGGTETELLNLLGMADISSRNAEISETMKGFNDKKAIVETANSVWID
ncbi:MAG: hypothetical protein J6J52_03700, partial [Oscillospiraceae bacterium]|nr:hypothetical protein [Oscillospiraceae bacterium]